jgi:predicted RNA binding protein YcfA (HicA-like mRNA interferase family)
MRLPRDLSGLKLIHCLCRRWGYRKVAQVGSHVTLVTDHPSPQRIVIPAHKALRVGTLNAVLRRIARHKGVSRSEILESL